jgi:replication initiation protein RepC
MQERQVTTPFGRRPVTLALVKRQVDTARIPPAKTADKWKVFRDASECREELGLQDRSLAVLDALLSFYPQNELRADAQLIVFPSNAQLMVRAHGITGATLRRHLAALVDVGLIVRKDSANGKRYARKDQRGKIDTAYGFDISPLLLRSEELALLAQSVAQARDTYRRTKEMLTISRRDVRKLISAAIEERADEQWLRFEDVYVELVARIPRSPSLEDLANALDEMELLQAELLNALNLDEETAKSGSNDAHNERHIQNSKPESIHELEPALEKEQARKSRSNPTAVDKTPQFPLGLVLRGCGEIALYAPGGTVSSWRDLMAAAIVVRSMLGVSPSAYQEACEVMGPENAAVTMACILERVGHINSPGGYLRDLSARAKRGEFSLGPVLMALLRSNGHGDRKTG